MHEAKYSQCYEEMNSLVLPGEEAGTAKVSYDHRQEILWKEEKGHQRGVTSWERKTSGVRAREAGAGAAAPTCWVNVLIWCQKVGCKLKKSREEFLVLPG